MFDITKITILLTNSTDKLVIQTSLPCATWPYEGFASLSMEIAHGQGIEYCLKHFPNFTPEIIDCK